MLERVELLVNLWTFGVPVVLMTWALLRLTTKLPARARYVLAIVGFVATLLVPHVIPSLSRDLGGRWLDAPGPHTGPSTSLGMTSVAVPRPIARVVTITWLAGALLLLLRDIYGHLRLRATRKALDAAPAELKCIVDARVPLLVSKSSAPFTLGLLRPAIVLPVDLLERFPIEVVQRIARHELSHARWRDPLIFAILRMIAALFWVSPVWLVLRWVRREREAAADAAALRDAAGEEESYVAALVRLSRLRSSRALAAAMAASDLEYRARRILAPQRASVIAVLMLGFGAALLAVASPAQLDADEPVVVRKREVVVQQPAPVVEVKKKPSRAKPKPKRAPPTVEEKIEAAIEDQIEEQIEEQVLPVSRDISSLQVPEPQHVHVDRQVDVDRHVDVARHVKDDDDDRRIRIVIRNRK